ncbi:preprotein translocase subunit SecG, partial [Methylophaga nitratireducenticrescens]
SVTDSVVVEQPAEESPADLPDFP